MRLLVRDFEIWKGYLAPERQAGLRDALRLVAQDAPLAHQTTPSGKQMSVQMTSAGTYGWISDRQGYRYAPRQPSGAPWPEIPESVLEIWQALVSAERPPDCCLINYYGEGARMGMHQDKDEADFEWPVLSISLGDAGLFRMGNDTRGGKTESHWLESGDVVVMGGAARLRYHGVDRIRFGSSTLLPNGGRINVTCRVVD